MQFLFNVNWIALTALTVVLMAFVLIKFLSKKIGWTLTILLSLAIGAAVGVTFASEDNSYIVAVGVIGDVYVRVITALVAPVISVSIISGFISVKDTASVKSIGMRSVFWLLLSAAGAIVLSIGAGFIFKLWGRSSFFEGISGIDGSTVSSYENLKKPFSQVILNLFPSNVVGDISANNVVAIIITAVAISFAYISIAGRKGEDRVVTFKKLVEAVKEIVFRILKSVIKLTPYAVLCLTAVSAGAIASDAEVLLQLAVLVGVIYAVSFIHAYIFNGALIKFFAKLNPLKFFKKTFQAQATAFTTQSSIGTLPVTIDSLKNRVGADGEITNFTAPLGTTVGMPGCTCVWPVLLVMFFVNAAGLEWRAGDYILLAVVTLLLSVGSAGVPGIAIVSSVAVFGALGLPVSAVVLLMPVNTVSDMARTLNNVTTAATATAIVARRENRLNDGIFENENNLTGEKNDATI